MTNITYYVCYVEDILVYETSTYEFDKDISKACEYKSIRDVLSTIDECKKLHPKECFYILMRYKDEYYDLHIILDENGSEVNIKTKEHN